MLLIWKYIKIIDHIIYANSFRGAIIFRGATIMEELNQLVELDIYFKYYEIFKKYMSIVESQYESLKEIKNKISAVEDSMSYDDQILVKKFDEVLNEIEVEREILDAKFNDYDFSKKTVKENQSDYKILCYKFVKDSINNYLNKYVGESSKNSAKFESREEFLYFIDKIEISILEFFNKNFNYTSEIVTIFDKAKEDIIRSRNI